MSDKNYMREYRKKRKELGYELLGGVCVRCGSNKNLQFDHITPEGKVNEISSMLTTKLEVFLEEIKKCQLLCYGCHLEKTLENGDLIHNRQTWSHGLNGYINHKCRCEVCKEIYGAYRKERWKKDKL
jgi:hypothetical protein